MKKENDTNYRTPLPCGRGVLLVSSSLVCSTDRSVQEVQMNQKNRKKIYTLTLCGLMSALAVVLVMLIRFPLFPAVPFLEYDAGDIPLFFISAICGPWYGLCATVVTCVVQGLTVSAKSGWVGIVMHFFATGSFVFAQGLVLHRWNCFRTKTAYPETTRTRRITSTVAGVAAMTFAMALWNLLFTPFYMGMAFSDFLSYYPWILLFNLIKAGVNGFLFALLYEMIAPILKKMHLL